MRRFLLIALSAGLLFPTAALSKSTWLIIRYAIATSDGGVALEKIKMSDMNQCELMGAKWMSTSRLEAETYHRNSDLIILSHTCLEGE